MRKPMLPALLWSQNLNTVVQTALYWMVYYVASEA